MREVVAAVEKMPRDWGAVTISEIHTDGTGVDGPIPEDAELSVLCRALQTELARIGFDDVMSLQLILDPLEQAECRESSDLCEEQQIVPSVVIP